MDYRIKDAAEQANDNAKAVRGWLSESDPDVPITSVAVFWSGARGKSSGWAPYRDGKAILVHGPDFRRWLDRELPCEGLDGTQIGRIWSHLVDRANEQDRNQRLAGVVTPPTVKDLAVEWLIKPMLGVAFAAYGFSLTRYAADGRVTALTCVAGVLLGILAMNRSALRRLALGWTAAMAAFLVGFVVALTAGAL